MRSIADGDRKLDYKDKEISATTLLSNDSDSDPIEQYGNTALCPETIITTEIDRALAEEDLKIIENHIKGNEAVEWVLIGIEDNMSASEIFEMSGMTKTQPGYAHDSSLYYR
jgi:hypothetical protein